MSLHLVEYFNFVRMFYVMTCCGVQYVGAEAITAN